MTMQPTTTQGSQSQEITVHDTVFKVMQLLDMAGEELTSAQQVVADCMRDFSISSTEMCRLQKLDLATQTVASVATVLRNLMSLSPSGIGDSISVARLYEGITLGDVVHVLKGETPSPHAMTAGEIDLF